MDEAERITLADGAELLVRPVDPGDEELLSDGYRRLSPESRRRRFLRPSEELSEEDLFFLTHLDHRRHDALVAIEPATGRAVGVARHVQVPGDRAAAEAAVAVVDDWQGRGIATVLLTRLAARARGCGIERYTAVVAMDNAPVLAALDRAGADRTAEVDGEVEFAFELPGEGLGDRLGAALREAATGRLWLSLARRLVLRR